MKQPFVQGDVARFAGDIVAVVVTESRAPAARRGRARDGRLRAAAVRDRSAQALEEEVLLFPEVGHERVPADRPADARRALFDDCEVVVSGHS